MLERHVSGENCLRNIITDFPVFSFIVGISYLGSPSISNALVDSIKCLDQVHINNIYYILLTKSVKNIVVKDEIASSGRPTRIKGNPSFRNTFQLLTLNIVGGSSPTEN